MNKSKLVLYALLIFLITVSVIVLSGNAALRVSGTYGFYFNDIQASDYVDSSLSNTELASEITGYFNSLDDEEFQIYEKNGDFLDPVFDSTETRIMRRAKGLLKWTLVGGAVLFVIAVMLYIYLRITGEKRHLRITGIIAAITIIITQAVKYFLLSNSGFRASLYNRFIGLQLNEESSLKMLLGSPMENVYLVFASVIAIAFLIVFLYVNFGLTKERGMFKRT